MPNDGDEAREFGQQQRLRRKAAHVSPEKAWRERASSKKRRGEADALGKYTPRSGWLALHACVCWRQRECACAQKLAPRCQVQDSLAQTSTREEKADVGRVG